VLTGVIVIILGLCVGSFLNVCIYRLPLGKSIRVPVRSFCPRCSHVIPWYDNIPFFSFFFLRGRCRFCGGKISFVYPIVELLTAGIFFAVYKKYGLSFNSLAYILLCCGLVVSSFVDLKHRIIPDEISVGGIIVGFLFNAGFVFSSHRPYDFYPLINSLLGIIIGGAIIYISGVIGNYIFKKESMGGGDVKLLAMVGAFLGYKKALFTFFAAPFFGTVVGIYVLIKKKDHIIPYGPFLSLAAFISLFWYEPIMKWIFPIS